MAATAASSLHLSLTNVSSRNNRLLFSPRTPTVLLRCRPSTCSVVALSSRSVNDKSANLRIQPSSRSVNDKFDKFADLPKQPSPDKDMEIMLELQRLAIEYSDKQEDKDASAEDLLKLRQTILEKVMQNKELVMYSLKTYPIIPPTKKSKKDK